MPKITNNGGGIISLPCGDGKTCLSIYLFAQLKVKTLVLVHKAFLMDQWKESITKFTNARIGEIRQSKIEIEDKDIVIAMLQTLSSSKKVFPKDAFDEFGFTITDEAHHIAAPSFSRALPIITSKYMLGLL